MERMEILVSGKVQGVGFRYFVAQKAEELGVCGYTENLFSGEVLTIAEGSREVLERFAEYIKTGPPRSRVEKQRLVWKEATGEFDSFSVRR